MDLNCTILKLLPLTTTSKQLHDAVRTVLDLITNCIRMDIRDIAKRVRYRIVQLVSNLSLLTLMRGTLLAVADAGPLVLVNLDKFLIALNECLKKMNLTRPSEELDLVVEEYACEHLYSAIKCCGALLEFALARIYDACAVRRLYEFYVNYGIDADQLSAIACELANEIRRETYGPLISEIVERQSKLNTLLPARVIARYLKHRGVKLLGLMRYYLNATKHIDLESPPVDLRRAKVLVRFTLDLLRSRMVPEVLKDVLAPVRPAVEMIGFMESAYRRLADFLSRMP